MKKVLVAFFSNTGVTEKMAEYIAEGIRFSGQEVIVKKIEDLNEASELEGYDGYILGSPIDSADIPEPMKAFLSIARQVKLKGRLCGTFGPYTHDIGYKHDTYAPVIIFDVLQNKHKMRPFELGPFNLNETVLETFQGIRNCQDYGRIFGEKLDS